MSLLFASLIIVSVGACALAINILYQYACADLYRLKQQEHWVGRFTKGARKIINDERTPREFLEMLLFLNDHLTDPESPKQIYMTYTKLYDKNGKATFIERENQFWANDEKFEELVTVTLFAGQFAATYADLVWGERARGAMARAYQGKPRETVLASVEVRRNIRAHADVTTDLVPA